MGFYRGPKIITDGLVLYLDAANQKSYPGSGTTWNDLSRRSTNGSLINGPLFSSDNNGSIVFDGVNDRVECSEVDTFKISSTITLHASFYIDTYVNWAGIVGRNNNSKAVYSLNLSPNSQRLRFNYNNISPWTTNIETTSTLPIRRWIISTVTYDGTDVKMYLNGVLDRVATIGSITFDTGSGFPLDIGYDNPGGDEYFNGNISQILIYNRALLTEEVIQNYNATKSRFNL